MYQTPTQQYQIQMPQQSYLERWLIERNSFIRHVPNKAVEFDSHLFQSGVLGWTYLGSIKTTRDRFLIPEQAYKTDIHECIHTDWEYETRRLTEWMLSDEVNKYEISLTKREEEKYYSTTTAKSE